MEGETNTSSNQGGNSPSDIESKQQFLRQRILDVGYDPDKFGEFMVDQKEGGDNLENWELNELKEAVEKFIKINEPITPSNGRDFTLEMSADDGEDFVTADRESFAHSARMSITKPSSHPFEKLLEVIEDNVVNCRPM